MPRLRALRAELPAAALAFAAFFLLLGGYYALRPIRDVVGSEGGPRQLAINFTCTFVVTLLLTPLYGIAAGRFRRTRFLAAAYGFFALALAAWAYVFATRDVAAHEGWRRAYFVWISAYNVFITSIFWSAMSDGFRPGQGRRWFGAVASGGTLGGIAGPAVTAKFAARPEVVLLVAAAATAAAIALVVAARRAALSLGPPETRAAPPPRATALEGARAVRRSPFLRCVALYLALATLTGAYGYNVKLELARAELPDRAARTAAFAAFEGASNAATFVAQFVVTPLLLAYLGARVALTLLPLVHVGGAATLFSSPAFGVAAWYDVWSRSARHGVTTPSRESLFTAVAPAERYQAKAFIDTVVYRGGDVAAAWIYCALRERFDADGGSLAASVAAISVCMVPIGVLWIFVARRVAALAPTTPPAPAAG